MGIPLKIDPDKKPSHLYEGIEYKDFWSGSSKNKLDEEEHAIVSNLLPASGFRIIDIGCGFGRLADCYLDRFEQVVMVDGSMTLLKQAHDMTNGRAVYIAADVNHLPFQNSSFDCALMIRVFHHISDSQTILLDVNRILIGSGTFVFNYSNKRNVRQFVEWILRITGENPFTLNPSGLGTTFIHHHPEYVRQELNRSGFSKIIYRGAGVMDKLAGRLGRFDKLVPSGASISPIFGVVKLAPWIFCKAITNGATVVKSAKNIVDILMCPVCKNALRSSLNDYRCLSCGRIYPTKDGISDFRIS